MLILSSTVPVTSYLRDSDEFCINLLKVSLDVREDCCKLSVRFHPTTGAGSAKGLKFPWMTNKDGITQVRNRPWNGAAVRTSAKQAETIKATELSKAFDEFIRM